MLSRDLQSLRTWFDATRLPGNAMGPEAAEAFSAALGVATEAATELERNGAAIAASAFDQVDGLSPETERLIRGARAMVGAARVVMLHAAYPLRRVDAPRDGGAP